MKQVSFSQNWNGALLNECFPILRPANEEFQFGDELQVHFGHDKVFIGYARIVNGSIVRWKNITDGMAHCIIAKPVPYLKSVMKDIFGFAKESYPANDFPVFFGFAQWTERHMPEQAILFDKFYAKASKVHTKIESTGRFQQPIFTL